MAQVNYMDRELPHNQEAEQSVIGSALTDPASVAASAEIVRPSDFYFEQNREIYSVIMELFNENIPVDIVTVSDRLNQGDRLDAVGGVSYLAAVASSVPTTGNVVYYSKIIREKSILRRLISSSRTISELAYTESDTLERILEQSEQLIFDVSSTKEQNDIVQIQDILLTAYQDMVKNALNRDKLTGVPTGFTSLTAAQAACMEAN